MNNYNSPVSKFFLVYRLGIDQGLTEECAHRRRLIKSHNTVVRAYLLESTQHSSLVATCQNMCMGTFNSNEARRTGRF
jgi:hypothetical protein